MEDFCAGKCEFLPHPGYRCACLGSEPQRDELCCTACRSPRCGVALDAGGNPPAVHGLSVLAQICAEEISGVRVAPNTTVFAGYVGRSLKLQVPPHSLSPPSDDDLFAGHREQLFTPLIAVAKCREG